MKGLILKDIYLSFHKFKIMNIIFLIGISIIVLIFFKFAGISMLSILFPIAFSNTPINLFVSDQKNNWDKYIVTTSISKNKVVISRYIASVTMVIFATIYAFTLNLACFLIYREFEFGLYGIICLVGFICALLYLLLLIPIHYKYGVNASNIVMAILVFLILSALYIFKYIPDIDKFILSLAQVPMVLFIIFAVLLLIIFIILSIKISCFLYKKKYV